MSASTRQTIVVLLCLFVLLLLLLLLTLLTLSRRRNILFTEEVVDGIPLIKAATLTKLVERLTFEEYPDPSYLQAFMLTYRSFTTPIQLLNILTARYNIPVPPTCTTAAEIRQWKEESQRAIRLRYENRSDE
jgi:hypothetical protein